MQCLGEDNQCMRNLEFCRGLFCPTGRDTDGLSWTRTSRSDFIAFRYFTKSLDIIDFETFPYMAHHNIFLSNFIWKRITD